MRSKLAYSKVEFQNFSRDNTPDPHFRGRGGARAPQTFKPAHTPGLRNEDSQGKHDKSSEQ